MTAAPIFEADERQRQAIEHVRGPMLVVAGAGTGKTTVLTRRIARLIGEGHARPDQILAVTYTDNAAREMRQRVRAELAGRVDGLQIETFHAYCNNLLIRCGRNFRVLDEKDLWIFLRRRIRELKLEHFVIPANVGKFLNDLRDFISRCHDELVGPERYAEYVARLERGELPIPRVCRSKDVDTLSDDEVLARCREIAGVFSKVEAMLREENLGTFGHMITKAYALLQQDPDLLARERERAHYALADEFQDANFAQVKILRLLAGNERNVFAVGDPDQAIYRFRGASSAAFNLFQHNFPEARLVALEKSRRSTSPILKCAYALITRNPDGGGRPPSVRYRRSPLVSAREEDAIRKGERLSSPPVEVVLLEAKDAEAFDLAETIKRRKRDSGCRWQDIAVLYRLHSHRDDLVEELVEQQIPFAIENMDVMDTGEARDLFACLGAAVSAHDDASLLRVAALPLFSVNPEKLRSAINALPREIENGGVALALEQVEGGTAVLEAVRMAREEIAAKNAAPALHILVRHFRLDGRAAPIQAVLEFVRNWQEKPIARTGQIGELIEYLELFREAGGTIPLPASETDAVRLMTAHTAKGLEFEHVFILRANSGSFPWSYKETLVEFPRELRDADSVAEQDDKTLHNEEERRLFYVAMTRARDTLAIYARRGTGKTDPTPAGYLRELIKDAGMKAYLRTRQARGMQTDIFAMGATAQRTGTAAWFELPPATDLAARLSASALQTYRTCPLQFKLERDWRIPGEVPAAMQYGATMHRVLRTYYDSVRFSRPMSEEAVIELFRQDLAEAGFQDRYQFDLYQQQGIDQLRGFMAACARAPVPDVLHTEEFFAIQVGPAAVVGRIDRMDRLSDGRIVITDYKTGRPQSQEDADKSLQLSIYALAAQEKWNYRAEHLILFNLAENSFVITRRVDAELETAKQTIQQVAKNIADGKFEANTGYHCRFCAYSSLCPATEKRLSTGVAKKPGPRN